MSELVKLVPAGDGHYIPVPVSQSFLSRYGHLLSEYPSYEEEYNEEYNEYPGNEDYEGYEDYGDYENYGDYEDYGDYENYGEEEWLSPRELELLRRREDLRRKEQGAASFVQTAATAGGGLVGTALGGPLGGAIGAAGGSFLGEAISPTPGKEWTWGRVGSKALVSAIAGGVSPLILPGIAPIASGVGSGIVGYLASGR